VIRRLAIVSAWLLGGNALWFAIFWGLLHVPESSVWMLALSAFLALVLIAVGGAVLAGASAAWDQVRPPAQSLLGGARLVPAALAAALLFGVVWWLTGVVFDWHTRIAGQIDAWVIARTGRPNARWIHFTIFWVTLWVRWSIGLTLASSLLAALVTDGAAALRSGARLRAALAPARWLTITFWFVLLVAIPWHLVVWRPARLSLAVEPWFVGAKLATIAVAMAMGWALVLRVGHGATEKSATEAQRTQRNLLG
jgi:hypothetical protein